MDKSILSQVERILNLYHVLPREPQAAYPIEKLKQKVQHLYNDEIDEKSIKKNILRDLKTIELILVSGKLIEVKARGRRGSSFCLSQNACIEQFGSELALVLVMAKEYLSQNLPNDVYEKVEGFFEAAEQQLEKNTQISAWHNKIRYVPSGYGKQLYKKEQQVLVAQKIYKALLDDSVWLDVLYRKEGSQIQTKYILKSQGIIQHGQKPYLMASKIVGSKSELRTFNMLRFDDVQIISEKVHVDIDYYDLEKLVLDREFEYAYFDRVPQDVFLVFHETLLEELELNPISDDQYIQQIGDDEYYELRATCCITTSLMDWFIVNSHLIQMVESDELREEIVHRAAIVLEKNKISDPIMTLESLTNG